VLERRPFNPRTADVWALGVTLHVLLTSRLPFGGDSDIRVVDEDCALTMMRRGLDLGPSGPSRSVRLSTPVVELLRGLLHYVTEVRHAGVAIGGNGNMGPPRCLHSYSK